MDVYCKISLEAGFPSTSCLGVKFILRPKTQLAAPTKIFRDENELEEWSLSAKDLSDTARRSRVFG